ncbi:aspartate aminotransferase family protein [Syntrophomonas wolfei]|uniref:Acetylornithine aminotransferase n=1 Tax=Syntrophomonas wolfei subsp. wolfei (strain DSM 2245B / Goettingen) TaxID=335541 RepID=Q0AUM5_SYNWW|nr:aspartate aminotransferase family protein [Syntrophomonas wolfei]ABI69579.1 acetylornithine aminotransferase [Syntrophomonas wolfei subsp. wolfei str. Goettingen G311]
MSSQDIMDKGQEYVMNTYGRFPIAPVKGKGCYLWDANGKQYLDFVGGIAVCLLGHCPDILNQTLREQSEQLWHVSNLYWIKPQVELAEKLVQASGMGKAFFCNSGAEANEAAIKLARKYFYRQKEGKRNTIIVFKNSFHGRTLATLTATGQPKYQEGFAPLPPGFVYAEFNQLDTVEALLDDSICAIMLEPIQGEGGIQPADLSFLRGLREICDQEGILLIFDEVQCGMGRSGKLLAYQAYGVQPDIVTLAKGLGGGFPIGAMLASEKAANGFAPGDHASTFGGNPLATALACKVVDTVASQEFLAQVEKIAEYFYQALLSISDPRITAVRGRGLMLGIEFNTEVRELVEICMEKGLLLLGAGPKVLRFVPPLVVSEMEINQAIGILKGALMEWSA